eukprot:g7541.t1
MSNSCTEMERAKKIGNEFVRVYYKVMRSFSSHLHLFYGSDSSVVVFEVQEKDSSLSTRANTSQNIRNLLQWMYDDVKINLFTCIPQPSMNGSILLVVTGNLKRKIYDEPRGFTQVLVLKRQSKGYYVKTDTMHIMSKERSMALIMPTANQKPIVSKPATKSSTPPSPAVVRRHQPNDSCIDCMVSGLFEGKNNSMATVVPLDYNGNDEEEEEEGTKGEQRVEDEIEIERENKTTTTTTRGSNSDCKSMDQPARLSSQATPTVLHRSSRVTHSEKLKAPQLYSEGETTVKQRVNEITTAPTLMKMTTHSAPGSLFETHVHQDSPFLQNKNPPPVSMTRMGETFKQPELKSMFAARLPLGATPAAVHALFSQYGTLNKDHAVKLFTGPTHCYACVTFESESEMRKALNSDIRLNGTEIVKEIWAPRSRMGRRTGREATHRPDSKQKVYRTL